MVISRRLDRFLVLRRGLNAKGAKPANVAKRLKIRVVRLIRVIRVERLLVLEKAMEAGLAPHLEGSWGWYNSVHGS